jgi:acetolactate synthase small subunit
MRQDLLTSHSPSATYPSNSEASATACFSIQAEADPGVMPRVLELFAKRGLIPSRWHSDLEGEMTREPALTIDLQVTGLNRQQVEHVSATLRGMVSVRSVLTSEKLYA